MISDVDELAKAVLKKPLQDITIDELQQAAGQHPFFGPVQVLLAKKLAEPATYGQEDPSQFEAQLQKASLYFQNRVWLDHLLKNDYEKENNSVSVHPESPAQQTILNTDNSSMRSDVHEFPQPTEEIIHESVEAGFSYEQPATTEQSAEPVEAIEEKTMDQTPVEEPVAFDARPDNVDQTTVEEPVAFNAPPAIVDQTSVEEPVASGAPPAIIDQTPVEKPVAFDTPPDMIDQTKPATDMQLSANPPAASDSGLLFEPYHTVDYFASQGIRYKEDEKPRDRFAMQLKSFTEWLKTLKQVNVAETPNPVDTNADKKVEQMAEFSLAERHVITEAMAEVWKKQGNKAKAEEIYRKLSLLEPAKSSYFAAKIEEIKKTY